MHLRAQTFPKPREEPHGPGAPKSIQTEYPHHVKLPAHEPDEVVTNRQPQPGATVLAMCMGSTNVLSALPPAFSTAAKSRFGLFRHSLVVGCRGIDLGIDVHTRSESPAVDGNPPRLDHVHGTMVIAVIAMGVVKVAIDEVIHVIAVGDSWVTATGTVNVVRRVAGAAVVRRAVGRVGCGDIEGMLIDVVTVGMMQVAVV